MPYTLPHLRCQKGIRRKHRKEAHKTTNKTTKISYVEGIEYGDFQNCPLSSPSS